MNFKYGIEHETAFINEDGTFADYTNTPYERFEQMVNSLPLYESDYPQLRVGDAGIKHKRWYIEGFERFDEQGNLVDCPPKGIEIRTTVHSSIAAAVQELTSSYELLCEVASNDGYTPIELSFNPVLTEFNMMAQNGKGNRFVPIKELAFGQLQWFLYQMKPLVFLAIPH